MGEKAHLSLLFHVSLFFFLFSSKAQLSKAADRLSPGQSLTGSQTITSSGDRFVLGFFTPGNSLNYYIGIWYKISPQTVIWVANRKTPLPNTPSQLKLTEDGNLVLFNHSNTPIWSSNSTSANPNSTVLVLLVTGNLVLRDGSNSTAAEIWQSFDHPTDTWMPSGRVGLNKITGMNQRLVSWQSSEDPAPGPFSLEIDPNGTSQYFILWNSSKVYWTSGTWNGLIFSLVPEMRTSYIYNFTFQNNASGNYFTYSVYDTTILSRFVMDMSGQIKQMTWLDNTKKWNLFWSQPRAQCDVYSLCGAFGSCEEKALPFCNCLKGFEPRSEKDWNSSDWSGGCIRKTQLQCGSNNGEKDGFWVMSNMQLPENRPSFPVGSPEECKSACLNNCSCNAYAYDTTGCLIWNGRLLNLNRLPDGASGGRTLYLHLAASELPSSSSKKGVITGAIVGSVAGVAVILAIVLVLIWRCRRRQMTVSLKATEGSLVPFSYRAMQIVTKNFSEKLGGGGFGSVFKGILPDSSAVAVKKLEGLRQGEKQFRTEVSTIGTIQHVNLIRLRGFCSEGSKRLLVYDYMPNSSLDSHLFRDKPETLDWKTRYQIALGTARGLAYLHEKCRDCIVHCDIKPENILLDATLCPKVADFGLAKLIGREFSRVLTTMRGTRGYLAPEWISGLAITAKADVYSYGMMLFEIISGRRNFEQSEDGKIAFFPTWAANKMMEGEFLPLLDPRLEGIAEMEELVKACKVACWCIQDDENDRPSMGLVVQILEGVLEVNLPLIPRSLQILVDNQNILLSTESSSAPSSQGRSNNSTSTQSKSTSSTSSRGELSGSNALGHD